MEANWFLNLSGSEKWRFQLARAFISNPHVLVVHRPVDELDPDLKASARSALWHLVDCRRWCYRCYASSWIRGAWR